MRLTHLTADKQNTHKKNKILNCHQKKSCCYKLAFKYDFMQKSISIKEEFSRSCLKMHLHYTVFL